MGWLRSLGNLSANTLQLAWGMAMDRIGRPTLFVFVGSLVGGILWLPLLFVSTPQQIIVIVVVQGLFLSMLGPSSIAVNDSLVPRSKRSQGVAELHSAWMLGSIPATLLAGYLMSVITGSLKTMYFLPIILAAILRGGSSLLIWPMLRREKRKSERSDKSFLHDLGIILQNKSLRILYMISLFQGFFMSFAWPLFPIANVIVTKNDMFIVAMLNVTHTAISSLIYPYFGRLADGRLADRYGKKPIIMLGRIGIALVPLTYAFATKSWHLFIAHIFWGIFMVAESITQAYILDNAQPDAIGTSLASYGLILGISTFLGSLASGYLVNELIILGFEQLTALSIGFLIAAGGRVGTGLAYSRLADRPTLRP
jgi:MFS family permease